LKQGAGKATTQTSGGRGGNLRLELGDLAGLARRQILRSLLTGQRDNTNESAAWKAARLEAGSRVG
jgi:hypothetical protein